ncbi:MAG TPA: molybdate ABC transporter substrate-binding protein [Geminicoccaceae bacterium]|nr:molybdate ABC transporter substrate-binding protein [Geminicoccus sp.]HMU48816.1 molybdate ABC transporter substrate-binding protein [Geminicoccaceae bacterium]
MLGLVRRGFLALVLGVGLAATAQAADTQVFAAASLKNALDNIIAQYKAETGKVVSASYAASSALARQIEQGAPADIFMSADLDWMDYLQQRNLIEPDTRVNLLGNRLVLIAPADSNAQIEIGKGFELAKLLGDGRLAVGETSSVPAGRYAKAALESLGAWASVESKLAPAENVRAAMALVARGEAPLGIVYETDAAADKSVKVVGFFPQDSHPPIVYPVALTAASTNPDAPAFLAYVRSARAAPLFKEQGFTLIGVAAGS